MWLRPEQDSPRSRTSRANDYAPTVCRTFTLAHYDGHMIGLTIQILRMLWARRLIVILASVCSTLGGLYVIQTRPPRYTAATRIELNVLRPDEESGRVLGTEFAEAYVETQAQLITDQQTAGRVVEDLGWTSNPALIDAYNARDASDDRTMEAWLGQQIIAATSVSLVPDTNILELKYRASAPETARTIADMLRDAYIAVVVEGQRDGARRRADWFQGQASQLKAELEELEMEKARYERTTGVVLQNSTDVDSLRLGALSEAVDQPRARRSMAGGGEASAQLAGLDAQLAQLASELGPQHPALQALRSRRASLAAQAGQAAAAAAARSDAPLAMARATEGMFDTQRAKVGSQRDALATLKRMQDRIDVVSSQYQNVAAQIAGATQQAQASSRDLSPVGVAQVPVKPEFPNKPLIIGGCLVLGAGFGVLLALLIELLTRRVRTPEDLRLALAAPLIGSLPNFNRGRGRDKGRRRKRASVGQKPQVAVQAQ